MTTIKSLRRQFFSCCVFWGKEYQQNCSCFTFLLFHLSTPTVGTEAKYNPVCHIQDYIHVYIYVYSLCMDMLTPIFPPGFQTIKHALHFTLLWTMVIIPRSSATGEMRKQRTRPRAVIYAIWSRNMRAASDRQNNYWHYSFLVPLSLTM